MHDRGKRYGRGGRPRPEREVGPPADPEKTARDICLMLLSHRARTRAELAEALAKRHIPDDVIERVLERYAEVGLVDDEAFAEAFVTSRHATRGLAKRALGQQLRQKGVDDETASAALAGLDGETERETARALVRRRLPATRGYEPAVRMRRLAGMLARKGYQPGLVYEVVREELAADGAEEAADWQLDGPPDESDD